MPNNATLLALLLFVVAVVRTAPTICTVGNGGTYPSIQSALDNCNGGAGDVWLTVNGTFFEDFVVPRAIFNLTMVSVEWPNIPAQPETYQVVALIHGSNHWVQSPDTALYFGGMGFDGQVDGNPFFSPWLVNQNISLEACVVGNFSGNWSIRGEACKRPVSVYCHNTRFQNVWGSTMYMEAMEDVYFVNNTLDQVGGFNNYSGVYLKQSFVAEGIFVLSDNIGWFFADTFPARCNAPGDPNFMTQCINGTLMCYSTLDTMLLHPKCQLENITYIALNGSTVGPVLDYPPKCRAYVPCVCQNIVFEDDNGTMYTFAIGDIFFYTGFSLNCSAVNGTPAINNSVLNLTFVMSLAGQNGALGVPPPGNETGWSLAPNIYNTTDPLIAGNVTINTTFVNCSCAQRNVSTLADLGIPCDYELDPSIPIYCHNGTVKNCSIEFLRCFALDNFTRAFYFPNDTTFNSTDNTTTLVWPPVPAFCYPNGTISLDGSSPNATACNASAGLYLNETLIMNGTFQTIGNESFVSFFIGTDYLCLMSGNVSIPNGEDYTILVITNDTGIEAICNSTLFNNTNCPNVSSDIEALIESNVCGSCTDNSTVESVIAVALVCDPYCCPVNYTANCTYQFTDTWTNVSNPTNETFTHQFNFTLQTCSEFFTNATQFPNGTDICPPFDPLANSDFFVVALGICASQLAACNNSCNCSLPNVTVIATNLTDLTPFPFNETTGCANYTCQDFGNTSCSCVLNDVLDCLRPYKAGNQSAMYHTDNIQIASSLVDLSNNQAEQLPYGWLMDRTDEVVIANNTWLQTDFSTENARVRWTAQWLNEFVKGTAHDFQYGQFGDQNEIAFERFYCDNLCPIPFVSVADFDCIADGTLTTPNAGTSYQTIQLAINAGCVNILVLATENFYAEDLIFGNNIQRLYSFNGATVLGSGHQIAVPNIDIRGLAFLHSGDFSRGLFIMNNDMDLFFLRNLNLNGQGVRNGGIIQLSDPHHIDQLVINSSVIQNWNFAAVLLSNVRTTWWAHNLFNHDTGRVIDITYHDFFRFHDNTLVEVRGLNGVLGVRMVRFVAQNEGACGPAQIAVSGGEPCAIYNIDQIVDVTQNDFADVCLSIVGGQLSIPFIFGLRVVKAQLGLELRDLVNITMVSAPTLFLQNPLVRNSLFYTTFPPSFLHDFAYDVFEFSPVLQQLVPVALIFCDWPTCDPAAIANLRECEVNPNFNTGYLPNPAVDPLAPTIPHYGLGYFHNASEALRFCWITRTNPYTFLIERPIYFTGYNGGRMFHDLFNITMGGESFYGLLREGFGLDQNICPECFPRSQIWGDGYKILADYFTSANMSYIRSFDPAVSMNRRDFNDIALGQDMWGTIPAIFAVFHLNFTNNTFDGGNLPAYSYNRILGLLVQYDESQYGAGNTPPPGGQKPQFFSTFPNASIIIVNNTFQNFSSFQATLQSVTNGQFYNTTIEQFPFTDPVFVWCLQELNSRCWVNITGNNFTDIDRRAVEVRYGYNVTVNYNRFINLGMRSPGNVAGILLTAARYNADFLNFSFNFINQSKPILSDQSNAGIGPAWYAHVVLTGYGPNGTECVYNNSITDAPIAIRWSGQNYSTIISCVNNATDPPQFYDPSDNLRRICFWNRMIVTASVHAFVYGEPYQDFFNTTIFCDTFFNATIDNTTVQCCIPGPPDACNVSSNDPAYVPSNPWFGTYLFTDINTAIADCVLRPPRIRVRQPNPYETYQTCLNPIFPSGHPVLNESLVMYATVFADPGATMPIVIQGCNHTLQAGRVIFQGFTFLHDCAPCGGGMAPTWFLGWNDTSTIPLPDALELVDNIFSGQNTTEPAIFGTGDEGLVIDNNSFYNYTASEWVNVTGRHCNVTVQMILNYFNECPGNCVTLDNFGGMTFGSNNAFQSGGQIQSENSVFHLSVCEPNATIGHFSLIVERNYFTNDSVYDPPFTANNTCGYLTFLWVDPVPKNTMSVSIKLNYGTFPGVCLREDNRPNTMSVLDPQADVRSIAQQNYKCSGSHYWVRENNGPCFDPVVDSDQILYRGYFCNNLCPRTNETQFAFFQLLWMIPIMLALICCVVCCCTNCRGWYYFSGVKGRYIPGNPFRWQSAGVVPGYEAAGTKDALKQSRTLRAKAGFMK